MNVDLAAAGRLFERRFVEPVKAHAIDAWRWWSGEILESLPPSWRRAFAHKEQRLFVELEGKTFLLRSDSPDAEGAMELPDGPVARGWGDSETVLILPSAKALVRSITLPLAAEENLREVLAFEMDRQTPFSAEAVYYDCMVTRRDPQRRTLAIDLIVAPRAAVDDAVDALAQRGITVDVVTARSPSAGVLPISLLARRRRSRGQSPRPLRYALAALAGTLLIAAIALPIWNKQSEISALAPKLADARAQAAETIALRHEVERLVGVTTYLLEQKQSSVLFMQALDEISRVLPEHSYASLVELAANRVTVQGQSAAADSLISLLEESSLLRNAQFDSSVVRVGSDGNERFRITAELNSVRAQ